LKIDVTIISGYWFSALAIALFSWRAWYIYRHEHEQVFRSIAEGTALLALADFLYGAAHFSASPRVLTGEFFAADTALIFGAFFACRFPVYYWSRIGGRRTIAFTAQTLLLALCSLATLFNVFQLLAGSRPLVQLMVNGTVRDGAPGWFNLVKALVLVGLGLGAGLTFFYQGVIDQAVRQRRLGMGILIAALSGVLLTVVNQTLLNTAGISLLVVGVALIVLGLFTPSVAPVPRPG
jgi:hypothetical protein